MRAATPPSASSSRRACAEAWTTWVGEVNRHFPSLVSISFHWSYRSRLRERARPRVLLSSSRRAMTNANPGTPCRHPLALLMRKSTPMAPI